jgi:hypothetical protein
MEGAFGGADLNRGQVQRKALTALAHSLGPDVAAEAMLSRDPGLSAAAAERSLLAPSFFCAVVVGGGKTRGFGLDISGTKQRLLDAVRTLENDAGPVRPLSGTASGGQ